MKFETIQSNQQFHGKAFDVRQDQVRLPDGKVIQLDIVDHRDSIALVPVDAEGFIWFIRQYRHAAGRELLELPAGVMEADERPEITAGRELREETGMAAGKIQKIGEFFLAPGYSTELMHIFLASELHPSPLPKDEDEFLQIEHVHVQDAYKYGYLSSLRDAKSIAALHCALPHLSQWLFNDKKPV